MLAFLKQLVTLLVSVLDSFQIQQKAALPCILVVLCTIFLLIAFFLLRLLIQVLKPTFKAIFDVFFDLFRRIYLETVNTTVNSWSGWVNAFFTGRKRVIFYFLLWYMHIVIFYDEIFRGAVNPNIFHVTGLIFFFWVFIFFCNYIATNVSEVKTFLKNRYLYCNNVCKNYLRILPNLVCHFFVAVLLLNVAFYTLWYSYLVFHGLDLSTPILQYKEPRPVMSAYGNFLWYLAVATFELVVAYGILGFCKDVIPGAGFIYKFHLAFSERVFLALPDNIVKISKPCDKYWEDTYITEPVLKFYAAVVVFSVVYYKYPDSILTLLCLSGMCVCFAALYWCIFDLGAFFSWQLFLYYSKRGIFFTPLVWKGRHPRPSFANLLGMHSVRFAHTRDSILEKHSARVNVLEIPKVIYL